MFDRIIVIGIGLIGGSFCLAARKNKLGKQFIGYDISKKALRYAIENNILDRDVKDLKTALSLYRAQEDDLIVLAVPLTATAQILPFIRNHIPNALITELGSAKGYLASLMASLWAREKYRLVPTHPIAGSENNEIGAARADLFDNCKTIITPLPGNDEQSTATISKLWQKLGGEVLYIDIQYHDRVFAYTSHLPHFLSYALMNGLLNSPLPADLFNYSAGGLRDFTRIAASDENMWHDIFKANRRQLLEALREFQQSLANMRQYLQSNEKTKLLETLIKAREGRYRLTKRPQQNDSETQHEEFDYLSMPCSSLRGELLVDGDKSICHRSLIFGSLAKGTTEISGFLTGEDTLATLSMFRSMGVSIERAKQEVKIKGIGGGYGALKKPPFALDCGNSGTAARLMSGVLCGQPFVSYLQGDASLSNRPMQRVIEPLRRMGGRLFARNDEFLPLFIVGHSKLVGITYEVPVPSAQVKSAIMLAAIQARGETHIKESIATRDHTERALKAFGYPLKYKPPGHIFLKGGSKLHAAKIKVPADISSAAFFMVAATICPDSHLILLNVGVNPGRTGVIRILQEMGGSIRMINPRNYGSEPVADLEVKTSSLRGISISRELVTAAIDELPILMIAAACAEGETIIKEARELRFKESNRLTAMVRGLKHLGVQIEETSDGAVIQGNNSTIKGGEVDSYGDHRIAMSFAVAGCVAKEPICIRNCHAISTSFPNFNKCAKLVGMNIVRAPSKPPMANTA